MRAAWFWYERGREHESYGGVQAEKSIDHYARALDLYPGNADAALRRARLLNHYGRWEAAAACLEHALLHASEYADLWEELGAAYAGLGQCDNVLRAHREALRLDSSRTSICRAIVDLCARRAFSASCSDHARAPETEECCRVAIACLDYALQFAPENADLWEQTAGVRAHLGQSDGMVDAYRQALRIDTTRTQIYHSIIQHFVNAGRDEDALSFFREAQRVIPDSVWVWSECGSLLVWDLRRFDEALVCYDRAVALKPDDPSVHAGRADAYAEARRYDEALREWDVAIALLDHDPSTRHWYTFLKGDDALMAGRCRLAEDCYREYAASDHRGCFVWMRIGQAQRCQDKPPEEQLESFQRAIACRDDDWESWLHMSFVLGELHRDAEALSAVDSALACQPEAAAAWSAKGRLLMERREYAEAISCAATALHYAHKHSAIFSDVEALELRAEILLAQGDFAAALTAADSLIAGHPRSVSARVTRAMALRKQKRYVEAEAAAWDAFRGFPKDNRNLRALGVVRLDQGRFTEAASLCSMAVVLRPQDAAAWETFGLALYALRRDAEALPALTQAARRDTTCAMAFFYRALLYARSNQVPATLDDLRKAFALNAAFRDSACMRDELQALRGTAEFQTILKDSAAPRVHHHE